MDRIPARSLACEPRRLSAYGRHRGSGLVATGEAKLAGFSDRLPAQIARYQRMGIESADSAFAPAIQIAGGRTAALAAGAATVSLSNEAGFGALHYTLDGAAPTADAPLYAQPFAAPLGTVVRAATFTPEGQPLAAARRFDLSAPALLTRDSAELEACPKGAIGLRVPLSPDATTSAPVFNVNLFDSCWIYPKVRLNDISAIVIAAARLPRNYGLAHDIDKVISHPARTPYGELDVRAGGCEGPVVASLPLPDPKAGGDVHLDLKSTLKPQTGEQALCLVFTAPTDGPLYGLDKVRLVRKEEAL